MSNDLIKSIVTKLEEFRAAVEFELVNFNLLNNDNKISASANIVMADIHMTIYYDNEKGKWF